MTSQTVNVVCSEERCVVGSLPAESMTLTRQAVWSRFRPVSIEYQLSAERGQDGDYFRCPRCGAPLGLEGAVYETGAPPRPATRQPVQVTREEARKVAVAQYGVNAKHVPNVSSGEVFIVLGQSRMLVTVRAEAVAP